VEPGAYSCAVVSTCSELLVFTATGLVGRIDLVQLPAVASVALVSIDLVTSEDHSESGGEGGEYLLTVLLCCSGTGGFYELSMTTSCTACRALSLHEKHFQLSHANTGRTLLPHCASLHSIPSPVPSYLGFHPAYGMQIISEGKPPPFLASSHLKHTFSPYKHTLLRHLLTL
jgi:hypothetical protein